MAVTERSVSAEQLEAACRALVRVSSSNLGLEVEMPVISPSGDFITVVVTPQDKDFIVHDAGFAVMMVANHGIGITKKMRVKLQKLAWHYRCSFQGERMTRTANFDELPLAVAVVANASRTIADLVLQQQKQPVFSFRDEVIERVKEIMGFSRVRENEAVYGKSGTEYNIGAVVLDRAERKPLAFVEAVRDVEGVNKRFREFYDISLVPEMEADCIVLYDDRADLRQGDLLVLQEVSNVVRFSDADKRLNLIRERA